MIKTQISVLLHCAIVSACTSKRAIYWKEFPTVAPNTDGTIFIVGGNIPGGLECRSKKITGKVSVGVDGKCAVLGNVEM